jgi:pyrrolysyl-tRNA synthetase-like protein
MTPVSVILTETQRQRLRELGDTNLENRVFSNAQERDTTFKMLEQELIHQGRQHLRHLRDYDRYPEVCRVERLLTQTLTREGFVQVVTPIIIAKDFLEKMSVTEENPLSSQVYWVSRNECLRPMLAPGLYYLLKRLIRLWEKPIRIFEVGPCFRKDSKGREHLNEFTMLNLVELGLPREEAAERLKKLASLVMEALNIDDYQLVSESSEVYGTTVDIVAGGTELCSAAIGPHPLDDAWGIVDPWVGLGLGLERIVMTKEGYQNIQRVGRSLLYLDGVRLNI